MGKTPDTIHRYWEYNHGNIERIACTPLQRDLLEMQSRCDVWKVLNKHKLTGAAAEIGVMYGHYTSAVIPNWRGLTYYCIDVWDRQDQGVYREKQDGVDYAGAYNGVVELSKKDKRIIVIKDFSVEAAKRVPDESLDWVFIDANHSYDNTIEDMDAWYPKVKQGGVFSGHDYHYDVSWPHFIEVRPAVINWMNSHGLQFVASDSSWWSVKP